MAQPSINMGMIPRGMREVAKKRRKIDGRGGVPTTIGRGLTGVDESDHGEMKCSMALGAGGYGMDAGAGGTESSSAAEAVLPMAAGNLPIENGGGGVGVGGGGGWMAGEGEGESSDWVSESDELVGEQEELTFYKWGVPDDEATEEVQEKVKTSNRFRVLAHGEFTQNQMGVLVESFKPFDTFYHSYSPDANRMLCILRFATRKQMKAAIERLPGFAEEGDVEIDAIARVGQNGGIKSGGVLGMPWCSAAVKSMSSSEGLYPNMVRVDRLPVTPDTNLEHLERELLRRMHGVGNLVEGALMFKRGRFMGWGWFAFSDATGANCAVDILNDTEIRKGHKIRARIFFQ